MADDARPVQTTTRPAASDPGYRERRFTVEEFDRIGQSGILGEAGKHELRSGRIVVAPPAGTRHGKTEAALVEILGIAIRKAGISRSDLIVQPHAGLEFADLTYLEPDAAIVAPVNVDEQRFYTPANARLVVEISDSSLADDLGEKRTRYAAAEIPEYWVIDVAAKTVHVFTEPSRGDYTRHTEKKAGATLNLVFEPEVSIAVDDLF